MTTPDSDCTVWLFRIRMPPRDRAAAVLLSDLHEVHRLTMHAFPDGPGNRREDHNVLWRADTHPAGGTNLLIQSTTQPDPERIRPATTWTIDPPREITLAHFRDGTRARFHLRANPTKKNHHDGKRVGLNGPEEQGAWLLRHQQCGDDQIFTVDTDPTTNELALVIKDEADRACRKGGRPFHFRSTLFTGTLTINDAQSFRRLLHAGVGPAKSYGFGYLNAFPYPSPTLSPSVA